GRQDRPGGDVVARLPQVDVLPEEGVAGQAVRATRVRLECPLDVRQVDPLLLTPGRGSADDVVEPHIGTELQRVAVAGQAEVPAGVGGATGGAAGGESAAGEAVVQVGVAVVERGGGLVLVRCVAGL